MAGAEALAEAPAELPGDFDSRAINKGTEICTPVYHDGHLYWAHQEDGVAYCVDAGTGKVVYEQRLNPRPGRIYASGVLAERRIYYVSRENGTYVVAAEPRFRLLAHNRIENDDVSSTLPRRSAAGISCCAATSFSIA